MTRANGVHTNVALTEFIRPGACEGPAAVEGSGSAAARVYFVRHYFRPALFPPGVISATDE